MLATMNTRPVSVWHGLHDDMQRWLTTADWHTDSARAWKPSVDVVEESENYIFRADLPGVELSQIDVLFDDGVLTIKGERHNAGVQAKDANEEQSAYHRIERSFGSFQRSFRLPDAIDADKITAKSDNGVLEVRVPKQEKTQRKIEIQS